LDTVHAIVGDVAERGQLLGLDTVAWSMRMSRGWLRKGADDRAVALGVLEDVNISTKLEIFQANILHLLASTVKILLQAAILGLKTIDSTLLILNHLPLTVMLSNSWKKLALHSRNIKC
jgi:hypothetical protein